MTKNGRKAVIQMMCPNCRCNVPRSMRYCSYCGYRFGSGESQTLSSAENYRRQNQSRMEYGDDYVKTVSGFASRYYRQRGYDGFDNIEPADYYYRSLYSSPQPAQEIQEQTGETMRLMLLVLTVVGLIALLTLLAVLVLMI